MGIVRLTAEEAVAESVKALGLDPEVADFETPEVIAESVRRAASFLCPAGPRQIVRALQTALDGLCPPDALAGQALVDVIESVASYGDLVEAPVEDEERGIAKRMLFLAHPAYIAIGDGAVLLLGVRAEGQPLLDDSLGKRVEHRHHTRRLLLEHGEDPVQLLAPLGLSEVHDEHWLSRPPTQDASDVVADYALRLRAAGPAGTIEGLRILDPDARVSYYRGRWRDLGSRDTGTFVARRPLAFGADGWCFAEVEKGEVTRLVDLPLLDQLDHAHDEAWRLQAAIDHVNGRPQTIKRVQGHGTDDCELRFFSPIPSWIQRRLDAVGRPINRQRGCLLAYAIPSRQLEQEVKFLGENMWLVVDDGGGPR